VFKLNGLEYVLKKDLKLDEFGLQVGLWEGSFEGFGSGEWLRWYDEDGNLLLSNEEWQAQINARLEAEKQRAEQEKQRAERLAEKLRALGINPDE
jgi:hypothetical protein